VGDNVATPFGTISSKERNGAQVQNVNLQALLAGGGGALTDLIASVLNGLQVDVTRVQGNVAVTGPVTLAELVTLILQTVEVPLNSITTTPVPASAAAVDLAAAIVSGGSRRTLRIYNFSTSYLFIREGAVATLATWGVRVKPYGYYEMPLPPHDFRVSGIWGTEFAAAVVGPTGSAMVVEGKGD